ncbi:mitochondrial carrier domain-containing protein [Dichotomocladium elegans]|nr:mitochondrial carrier domain-containing protein [Dichotomocladium elegans]
MPSYLTDSRLNGYEAAFCGATAGVVTRFITAPLDVVKIRMQLQSHTSQTPSDPGKYSRMIPALKTILREEGVRGLYKGNLAAEYLYLLYSAVEFYAYRELESLIETMDLDSRLPRSAKTFISGMLAGSIATGTTYPFDLLRTRFAMQGSNKHYTGIVQAIQLIYRTEGMRGFYWGISPAVVQIMPYMGLVFATYDGIAVALQKARENHILPETHKPLHDMLSGALSGVISKTAVYPMDVVRKRLQVQGPYRKNYVVESIPEYASQSWIQCIKTIVEQEGVRSLYRGLGVSLVKVAPAISLTFFVYEKTKNGLLSLKSSS